MTRLLDNISSVAPDEFKIAVALGRVPGWTAHRQFGTNDAVPATGSEEIWPIGTTRVLPTSAAVVAISSDDAADTAAGTGAQTVTVSGLDANYGPISETVALNGVSTVNTVASFLRINQTWVATAGTGEINAGNITLSIGGDAQSYIELNEGNSHHTQFTVPADSICLVRAFSLGVGRMAGNTDCHIQSQIKLDGAATAWRAIEDNYIYNGAIMLNEAISFVVPAKTEIRQVVTSTVTTQVFSTWEGYLIDTTAF